MTDQQMEAARLVAEAQLTVIAIAKKTGASLRTVYNWKADPEFQAQVKLIADEWRSEVRRVGAADQDIRIKNQNDRLRRLKAVIQERAADPSMQEVPGGKSGLLTISYKMLSRVDGEGNRISEPVPEYSVDTAVLAEMRAIEQHLATELGQWKQKVEHSGDITLLQRFENARKRLAEADDRDQQQA